LKKTVCAAPQKDTHAQREKGEPHDTASIEYKRKLNTKKRIKLLRLILEAHATRTNAPRTRRSSPFVRVSYLFVCLFVFVDKINTEMENDDTSKKKPPRDRNEP